MKFNNKFNFITGPNGCGKSSILTGIHHCLYHDYNSSRLDKNSCFHIEVIYDEKKIFWGLGKNSFKDNNSYRQTSLYMWQDPSIDFSRLTENYEILNTGDQNHKIIPLFLGTKRSIDYKKINGTTREESYQQSQNSYLKRNLESDNSNVKQWFINRYFIIDKDWAVEEKTNWYLLLGRVLI